MAHPHRLGAYPSHDDGSFPLLVLFDDSLHNRWAAAPEGLQPEFDSAIDVGRLRGGHHVPCGQSIRATFKQPGQALMLRASDPMVVSNVTAPLLLSLAFTLPTGRPTCAPTPVHGRCDGSAACVSLRLRGTAAADTVFVPLCGNRQGPPVSTAEKQPRWQQMKIPLEQFALGGLVDELVVVPGAAQPLAPPLVVHLDELWLSAARPPLAGDSPPSYGRSDINVVQSTWLQGVTRKGAANSGKSNQNAHFCEYMSSELGKPKKSEQRPLCRGATGGKGRPPCSRTAPPSARPGPPKAQAAPLTPIAPAGRRGSVRRPHQRASGRTCKWRRVCCP